MSPPLCFICRLSEWTLKSKKKSPGRWNKQYGETMKCHPVELNVLKSETFTQLGHLLQVWLRFPYSMFYAFDWRSAPDKMSYFYTYSYFSAGLDGDSITHPSPATSTCMWDITFKKRGRQTAFFLFFRSLKPERSESSSQCEGSEKHCFAASIREIFSGGHFHLICLTLFCFHPVTKIHWNSARLRLYSRIFKCVFT